MKRFIAAALVALSVFAAAPAASSQPADRAAECHKVKVHRDDGTEVWIRVCLRTS